MKEQITTLPALHRSWHRFKLGLMMFVIGAMLFMTVSQFHIALYYLSLGILLGGFAFAMLNYLVMLWLRLKAMNPANKRRFPGE